MWIRIDSSIQSDVMAFYSHMQLPSSGDNVIKISKNEGHSQLVMKGKWSNLKPEGNEEKD